MVWARVMGWCLTQDGLHTSSESPYNGDRYHRSFLTKLPPQQYPLAELDRMQRN